MSQRLLFAGSCHGVGYVSMCDQQTRILSSYIPLSELANNFILHAFIYIFFNIIKIKKGQK